MSVRAALERVLDGERLARADLRAALGEVFLGEADPVAFGGLLVALAQRGETREELIGAAEAMRAAMVPFAHDAPNAVDTCGTGGSGLDTFNVSTASALVAAAAGAQVIKHGNRSASSKSGSADLLEAIGLPLELDPEAAREVLDEVGITFLFAPRYHPAMRHAGPVRRSLGVRTLFNLLGPLCNPGGVRRQVLGVYDHKRVGDLVFALQELGGERGLVVQGAGGADELTLQGVNVVREYGGLNVRGFQDPAGLGLEPTPLALSCGGDVQANARELRGLLAGEAVPSRSLVLLNAAAALVVAGVAESAEDGVAQASAALEEGAVSAKLDAWVQSAQRAAGAKR